MPLDPLKQISGIVPVAVKIFAATILTKYALKEEIL